MKKQKNKKARKFPEGVARFFNQHKSGTNAEFDKSGRMLYPGTHQYEKSKERSYIPVYSGGGTARRVMDEYGRVKYV